MSYSYLSLSLQTINFKWNLMITNEITNSSYPIYHENSLHRRTWNLGKTKQKKGEWFVTLYFFRPRETGFRLFRDPWNMHLLSRDFWTNDFCENNFSLFLEILASLKLVNYTKLDVKPAHSMSLWMEDWELTTATAICRLCNHGQESRAQESWDKFALLAFLRTRHTRIQPLNLALTPHTMLKTTTCNFFWFPGKIVFEGRGKVTRL